MRLLQRVGRFYSRLMMKNIGILIFIGLLSVVFNDCGWFPNEDIYAISQLVYAYILPTMIAYEGGRAIGGDRAGVLACLAVTGIVMSASSVVLPGAMVLGPLSGMAWKRLEGILERRIPGSMQMLIRNLCIAAGGGVLAILGYFLVSPVLQVFTAVIYRGVHVLISCHMEGLLSLVIEPAKIFFLNNVLNHAVLVPLAMGQVQETGRSILFLLETNPGPGFGLLTALYCSRREERGAYGASMLAELIGGIHEVYFPFVLSDLRLLPALMAGGVAGSLCFDLLDGGIGGVVSPGSVIIMLLMAGRRAMMPVLAGIVVSAAVSFGVSMVILSMGNRKDDQPEEEDKAMVVVEKRIESVVFVCDGGVGSSAMGAAIFRRGLARRGITGIHVEAYAADLVPEDADLLVCQKDFCRLLPEKLVHKEIYTVDNLVSSDGYGGLMDEIEKRNG